MEDVKIDRSSSLFAQAQQHLVGGVNSPVRSFTGVGGCPRFIKNAKGALITDEDNKSYIDFVGSWGPMILGHQVAPVVSALKSQLMKGTSYGAPTSVEVKLAAFVKEAFPSIDLLRMTSSGTEATMAAIRLARGVTKRDRLVKFEGAYHGHADSLLVAAGSGATTFGVPSSAGVPEALARHTWVLPYNDTAKCEELFRSQGPNIAAVIVEPVAGNMGVVAPAPKFLETLRRLTFQFKSVLIFDEVMTGFRLAFGGAQQLFNIRPDITCLGKILGAGLPVGAFGGRKDVMRHVAPLGSVYQAGTLSGNPLAMTAGLALLQALRKKNPYALLDDATSKLCSFIREEAKKSNIPVHVNQAGSMFTVFFSENPVHNYFSATQSHTKLYARFFHGLLEQGVYFPPSQFEAAFVSTAHTPRLINKTKQAISRVFSSMKEKPS